MMESDRFAATLGYTFRQPALLRQALTHRSHSIPNNERLEFLGDSILNFVIALRLYERFPKLSEGELSRLRANLVNQTSLFEVADTLRLGEAIALGEGELKSGGFRRPSILADALEAIFGAVFLDGGFAAAEGLVTRLFADKLEALDPKAVAKDAKTKLQEWLQGRKIALPTYQVTAVRGEAHDQTFCVECSVPSMNLKATGEGASRRAAEQTAAEGVFNQVISQIKKS
jgi:ribonuclease III